MNHETDMTDLRQAAVAMHEMYRELKAAGFARGEALQLVAHMMAASVEQPTSDEE